MPAYTWDQNNNLYVSPGIGTVARVNAGAVSPGQTDYNVCGRCTGSASVTTTVYLGTVPSNKTLFLTDINMSTVSTNECDLQIQYTLGGVTIPIFRQAITSTSPCTACGIESQPSAPSGAVVSLLIPVVAGPPNIDFAIGGFQQ